MLNPSLRVQGNSLQNNKGKDAARTMTPTNLVYIPRRTLIVPRPVLVVLWWLQFCIFLIQCFWCLSQPRPKSTGDPRQRELAKVCGPPVQEKKNIITHLNTHVHCSTTHDLGAKAVKLWIGIKCLFKILMVKEAIPLWDLPFRSVTWRIITTILIS